LGWLHELFVERFTLEYQEFLEGMSLVQMRYMGFLKANLYDLNIQMNDTPKMDKSFRKCIFLGLVGKVGNGFFVEIPKVSRRHGGDH
jgi:hypothetical protein